MRRRLDLAASLMTLPPVLFLDEPTTGLDPTSRQRVWEAIRELLREGVTVLLTTQYLDEADALANRIVVIDHGRVIVNGTPQEFEGGEPERTSGGDPAVLYVAAAELALAVAAGRGRVHLSDDGGASAPRSTATGICDFSGGRAR